MQRLHDKPIVTFKKKKMYSPVRYAGGKSMARKIIMPYINTESTMYVEPFCGGASIFFGQKSFTQPTWLNDLDSEVINLFTQIRDYPKEMHDIAFSWSTDRDQYNIITKMDIAKSTPLQRAARYFYLNRTSYSGIMCTKNCHYSWCEKTSMKKENWWSRIQECSKHLQNCKLTCLDFEEVINNCPDGAFLFVDPPYYARLQDRLYDYVLKDNEAHLRLMNCLQKNKDRLQFLMTYDNHDQIKSWYSWATVVEAEWNYGMGRTDRADGEKGKRTRGKELFIYYEPIKEQKRLTMDSKKSLKKQSKSKKVKK